MNIPTQNRSSGPLHILVVDEHEVVRRGLESVLQRSYGNCVLGHASSSGEGLSLIPKADWSLAIVDTAIRPGGAMDFVESAVSPGRRIPVLVYSNASERDHGMTALQRGASGYVCKKDGVPTLLRAADLLLQGRSFFSPELTRAAGAFPGGATKPASPARLTEIETKIVQFLGMGIALKEIASRLSLSTKTISTHRARIIEKMNMGTLTDLVKHCLEHKLV